MSQALHLPGLRHPSVRKLALCLLVAAVILTARHQLRSHEKPTSRFTAAQIAERAQILIGALYGPAEITQQPEQLLSSEWVVSCRSGLREFHLTFEDSTGRLKVFGMSIDKSAPTKTVAPVTTAAEANEVALHRLQALQMLPSGSKLRLERAPFLVRPAENWQLAWQIQAPQAPHPYHLTMVLDRDSGMPICIR